MSSARFYGRNVSPSPSGPVRKRPYQGGDANLAPPLATASASSSVSATAPAPTTYANTNATNLPDTPLTPPNAPRRALDENHPAPYTITHQSLFDKLYGELREGFQREGRPKTRSAVLTYARERLVAQSRQIKRQAYQLKEQGKIITEQEGRLEVQEKVTQEQEDRITECQKRNGYLEGLLIEHGLSKEWIEYVTDRMEKEGKSAKEMLAETESGIGSNA
jgi:hypothetical protein